MYSAASSLEENPLSAPETSPAASCTAKAAAPRKVSRTMTMKKILGASRTLQTSSTKGKNGASLKDPLRDAAPERSCILRPACWDITTRRNSPPAHQQHQPPMESPPHSTAARCSEATTSHPRSRPGESSPAFQLQDALRKNQPAIPPMLLYPPHCKPALQDTEVPAPLQACPSRHRSNASSTKSPAENASREQHSLLPRLPALLLHAGPLLLSLNKEKRLCKLPSRSLPPSPDQRNGVLRSSRDAAIEKVPAASGNITQVLASRRPVSPTGCCNREGTCCFGEHYPGPRQQEARLTLSRRQANLHTETTQYYPAPCPAHPRPHRATAAPQTALRTPTAGGARAMSQTTLQAPAARGASAKPQTALPLQPSEEPMPHPRPTLRAPVTRGASTHTYHLQMSLEEPAPQPHESTRPSSPDGPARPPSPFCGTLLTGDLTVQRQPPRQQPLIEGPAVSPQRSDLATPKLDRVSPTTSNASIPPEIPPQHPTEGNPDPRDRQQADHATGSKPATDEVEDPEDQQPMVRAATLWQIAWTEELQAAASFDDFNLLVDRLT
ncbi:hypothetical protein UY3_10007 [Chelonia mydas]|uniref:Uncharacterized protein n=1 Tax=Chelonia mydas TaxID=8469 RepID=M7BBE0_CHEMY|nr:hypothetical protein UY3_10007 [Chelonia mydas]